MLVMKPQLRAFSSLLIAALVALAPMAASTRYDVIVYGSTPAGVLAAVAAARSANATRVPLSVLLLSPTAHVGGMCSGGLGHTDTGSTNAIGGYAHEFFLRVGVHYGSAAPVYDFEPHVAERVFLDMLADVGAGASVTLVTNQTLIAVTVTNRTVTSIQTAPSEVVEQISSPNAVPFATQSIFEASVFVDASYEGDLMGGTGTPFAVGREGQSVYGESLAGRLEVPNDVGHHQLLVPLNYTNSTGGLLPMIYTGDPGAVGAGDVKVQAYNYRLCLTQNKTNSVPIGEPGDYEPAYWELLRRYIAAANITKLGSLMNVSPLPNGKTDVNNNGPISTDFIGGSWAYPVSFGSSRADIVQAHKSYTQGFLWFLASDPAVPVSVRKEMASYGLAADEFVDTDHWPDQLYVREARRMVSDFVFTQADRQFNVTKPDSIGLFSYNIDTHNSQRFPQGAFVRNEGDVEMYGGPLGQIPYRVMVPATSSVANLLVPVAVSASHIGFGCLRLEPQWMIMGHAAGAAAFLAVTAEQGIVQHVNVTVLQHLLVSQQQLIDI